MTQVGTVSLLGAIAVPNFLRARERSQATTILNDARMLDAASDQWAIEENVQKGAAIKFDAIKVYLKQGSRLFNSGGADVKGNAFLLQNVGDSPQIKVNEATVRSFDPNIVCR